MPLPSHQLHPRMAPASRLFAGTASLGGRVPAREGLRALDLARELGVTGLDTARSYGFGEAEALIGRHLTRHAHVRDTLVLATKAGIAPSPAPRGMDLLAPAGRLAEHTLAALPAPLAAALRTARARLARSLTRPRDPTAHEPALPPPEVLETSLLASLRALRTDRVDIFLAHRCPATPAAYDDFASMCERQVTAGRVLLWGICGTPATIAAVSRHAPPPVVQMPASALAPGASSLATAFTMLYQPFGGPEGVSHLDAVAPPSLHGADRRRWLAEVALRLASEAASRAPHALVCAMNRPDHVATNVAALDAPWLSAASLAAIGRRLRETA
jgi:aryl-alcohol dehydrogenase-like predicted oxidoreductase